MLEVGEAFPAKSDVLVFFGQGGAGGGVEVGVVVAGDYVFVLVWEGGEEVDGVLQLRRSAVGGYVASVDEDISVGNFAWVERVGV